jgi:GTP-binding protein
MATNGEKEADVGAAEGYGLGNRFLRPIERTRCLAFVIDSSEKNPYKQYQVIRSELEKFHPLLLEKPKIILLNKVDLGDIKINAKFKKEKIQILQTSSVSGAGLEDFKKAAYTIARLQKESVMDDKWES